MSSVQNTLDERGERYGDFADHAVIAQNIQDAMRSTPGWGTLGATHKQALTVIADKIARILNGDPDYADNWHDIQGYARLVEERLPANSLPPAHDDTFEAKGLWWTPWDCRDDHANLGPDNIDSITRVLLRDGGVLRVDKKSPAAELIWGYLPAGNEGSEIVGYGID